MQSQPEWVRKYVGLPSQDCGRGPSHFDCYGLLRHVYDVEKGIGLPAFASLSEEFADAAQAQIEQERGSWLEVEPGTEQPLDLVLCYKTFRQGKHYILRPLHIGVVSAPGVMLHAEGKIGACLEEYRENPIWARRVAGFFRHTALARGGEVGPADPFLRHEIVASEGTTIAAIVAELGMGGEVELEFVRVTWEDGTPAMAEEWDTPLRAGTRLCVSVVPKGGGAGLRIGLQVGIIGLAIAATVFAGPLGGLAVSMLGTIAMGMFLPPPSNKPTKLEPSSPAYSISGARNSVRPGSPVPSLFGKFRTVPPMAGWYTASIGNKRYFYGIYEISSGLITDPVFRIGDTSIDKFTGVTLILDRGWHPTQLVSRGTWNPRNGWPSTSPRFGDTWRASFSGTPAGSSQAFAVDDTVTFNDLYSARDPRAWDHNQNKARANWPASVLEENVGASIKYGMDGVTRTSRPGADELQIDLGLDQLGRITGQGKFDGHTVKFDILEAPVENPSFKRTAGKLEVSGKTQDAVFTGHRWTVSGNSPSGQYDVTVRRLSPDTSGGDSTILADSNWLNLKTIIHEDPVPVKGYARVFVKIKASGQLTGVLDKLTVECQRIGPRWNKTTKKWEWKPSSNPATAYRLLLQTPFWSDKLADTSISLTRLQEWAEFCDTQKCAFDAYVDFATTRDKLLSDICLTGFAAWTMEVGSGKMSVARDPVDQENPLPIRFFSPANSWNIRWQYSTDPIPDSIRVTLADAKQGYAVKTFEVYNDGKNSKNSVTNREQQYLGVTDKSQAHLQARMELANLAVRRMIHTRSVGPEYLACEIGSVVGLADDSLAIGLGRSGRIQELTYVGPDGTGAVTGCVLDQPIEMVRGETYALAISGEQAHVIRILPDTRSGGTSVVRFAEPLAEENIIRPDDTWTFGTSARTVVPVMVRDIRPDSRDGSAEITFVPLPPLLSTVLIDIPEYQDFATLPRALPAPIVDSIVSDATVMQSTMQGDLVARVVFRLRPIGFTGYSITVMFRLSNTDHEWSTAQSSALSPGQVVITGVSEGFTYDFILFYEGAGMFTSPATTVSAHRVVGRTAPPAPLSNIQINVLSGNVVQVRWDEILEADVRAGGGIFVRHAGVSTGANWAASMSLLAQPLDGAVTQTILPYLPGTYLFRVRDSSGLWSEIASAIVLDHSVSTYTSLSTIRENPAFEGEKQNLSLVEGNLRILAMGFNAIPNVNAIPVFNSAGTTVQGLGIYYFNSVIDLGETKHIRVRRHMIGFNEKISDVFNERSGTVDSWESWDGVEDAPGDCWLEVRHSLLDPVSNPWSGWTRIEATELTTRWLHARGLVFTTDAAYTFVVEELGLNIDVI